LTEAAQIAFELPCAVERVLCIIYNMNWKAHSAVILTVLSKLKDFSRSQEGSDVWPIE